MDYKRTTVEKQDLFWIIRLQRINWSERACLKRSTETKSTQAVSYWSRREWLWKEGGKWRKLIRFYQSRTEKERETGWKKKGKKGQEGGSCRLELSYSEKLFLLGTFKAPLPPPPPIASLTFHLQPCSCARSSQTPSQARCRQTRLELCSQPWWFWGMWPPW